MGGVVLETQTEKWIREGREQGISQGEAKMLIKMGQKYGLEEATILEELQKELDISFEQAMAYFKEYRKQPV